MTDTRDSDNDSETQSKDSRDSNYDSETTDSDSDDEYENDKKNRKRPKKGKHCIIYRQKILITNTNIRILHQNISITLAVIRAMVEVNRTTTVDIAGDLETHSENITLCNWKVYIYKPCKRSTKWTVLLASKMSGKSRREIRLRLCDSMETAEATKSRVLTLLRTMSAHEIKEQFVIENKELAKNDWHIDTKRSGSELKVCLRSKQFQGIRTELHVGVYETKLESDKVVVLLEKLLKTLDPRSAISQIQMLQGNSRSIRPDNPLLGEHDAQQESVLNLPFIDDKNNAEMRNIALDRIALFKAYYYSYISNNRSPVFWVPSRRLENTMLALLPNGLHTLSTKDRSPHSQTPKMGQTAKLMLLILEEAENLLQEDTAMRQRWFFFNTYSNLALFPNA